MTFVVRRACCACCVLVAACASACAGASTAPRDEPAAPQSTIDGGDDVDVDVDVDVAIDLASLALVDNGPFLDDEGDAVVPCGEGGVLQEQQRVEVRTAWCDPADLATTLPLNLSAGTLVIIELSHDALIADGGDVHLAVVVGDEVVWQRAQTLPQPPAYVHERIPLARDHDAGERVVVHVHNHGANTYTLHALRFAFEL